MSYAYDSSYSPVSASASASQQQQQQHQQQQQQLPLSSTDSHVGINMNNNYNNNHLSYNHNQSLNHNHNPNSLSPSSNNSSIQTRLSPSTTTTTTTNSTSTSNSNSNASSSSFSSLSFDQQPRSPADSHQLRLSAYVSPRLLNADAHQLPSGSGGAKEFRDREFGLGLGPAAGSGNGIGNGNGVGSNLGRSLSLGDRHHHGSNAGTGGSNLNAGYQPHSSSNLSHSTSNASASTSHHRLLASPALTNSNQSPIYSSSQYYNNTSTPSAASSNRISGDLPLPASATASSSSYNLLPLVNTQLQSTPSSYNPNQISSPSASQLHSSLGMDSSLQPHNYSPRSPAGGSNSRQQNRPHSYYDPNYGPTGGASSGVAGVGAHRQSIGPAGFSDLTSPSQWKPSSNSRRASPSNVNTNVNVNLGMVGEDAASASGSRLSQRSSRNQDLPGGGLPTHNNHGIYDLRPSSSSAGINDSLPYAYNSNSSRDFINSAFSASPQNQSSHPPPPPPQSSSSLRNSTLGLQYLPHQSNSNPNWNPHQQATSPASTNSTVHGNSSYDPTHQTQSQHQSILDSTGLNRSTSLRNQPPGASATGGGGGSSGFHRVERNLREPAKEVEFRRVRDSNDLRPSLEAAASGKGRRADPMGGYVSPLKALTAYLHHTYHLVNPAFFYELSFNPRRVLTKPSRPCHNDGHDNEDSDYILYVNDWLGTEEGNRYLILDVLGQGTFGQVVKCQNMKTHEIVAVKVIKNKPAYFNQSMMEVTILEILNGTWDPNDKHHILRLRDTFIHAKHLCLVFELLSSNLYELIKQNSFRGLSTSLVRVFTAQLLDALTVLNEAKLIHCDLKPENILLKTLQDPSIKLVDFGSACHERQTVYTYIQSRFYRSPEVLLGLPYSSAIDMWSLGCIAVELFLGLPLFPGTSEYNQVCRIVEMLGLPPSHMMEQGKQTNDFFHCFVDHTGRKSWRLKSLETYSKEHNVTETPSKKYFTATKLPDIIKGYSLGKKAGKPAEVQKEMAARASFIDFVEGLLNMDPAKRWTPQQAKLHPFITNERFVGPFVPPSAPGDPAPTSRRGASGSDSTKHPYGGLPQTQQRSSRAYHDAAAYNQHLAQQQSYNSVATARQSQPPPINNPYAQDTASVASASGSASTPANQGYTTRNRANTMTRMENAPPSLSKIGIDSSFGLSNPNASSSTGVAHSALTPVSNREEWDRRQGSGGSTASNPALGAASSSSGAKQRPVTHGYQGMELLQGQSELPTSLSASAGWAPGNWSSPSSKQPNQSSPSMYALPSSRNSNHLTQTPQHPGSFSVVVDRQGHPQDQHHHHHHHQQQQQQQQQRASMIASPSRMAGGIAAPPPAAYSSNSSSSTNRYEPGMRPSSGGAPMGLTLSSSGTLGSGMSGGGSYSNVDTYDSGISQLMPALKPTQYSAGGVGGPSSSGNHYDPNSNPNQRRSVLMSPNSSAQMGGIDPRAYSSPSNANVGGYAINPTTTPSSSSFSHAHAHAQAHARAQIPLGMTPGSQSNARAGTLGPDDAFGLQDWGNSNQRRPPSAGNRGY